jgi:hypothetical protein
MHVQNAAWRYFEHVSGHQRGEGGQRHGIGVGVAQHGLGFRTAQ